MFPKFPKSSVHRNMLKKLGKKRFEAKTFRGQESKYGRLEKEGQSFFLTKGYRSLGLIWSILPNIIVWCKICFDMIWYDMIRYDTIRYVMILICFNLIWCWFFVFLMCTNLKLEILFVLISNSCGFFHSMNMITFCQQCFLASNSYVSYLLWIYSFLIKNK